jgi:transcriptional regulator with XRE-family HTH domain
MSTVLERTEMELPPGRRSSKALAGAVREVRQGAGLSQADLAVAVGVTQGMVSQWERAVHTPGFPDMRRIEKTCRLPRGALLRLAGLTPEFDIAAALATDPDLLPEYRKHLAGLYRDMVKLSRTKRDGS